MFRIAALTLFLSVMALPALAGDITVYALVYCIPQMGCHFYEEQGVTTSLAECERARVLTGSPNITHCVGRRIDTWSFQN